MQARIWDFGQGGPAEFWPQGGPWAQNLLQIGVFPLKLPENCIILKKFGGKGGPTLDPLLVMWPGFLHWQRFLIGSKSDCVKHARADAGIMVSLRMKLFTSSWFQNLCKKLYTFWSWSCSNSFGWNHKTFLWHWINISRGWRKRSASVSQESTEEQNNVASGEWILIGQGGSQGPNANRDQRITCMCQLVEFDFEDFEEILNFWRETAPGKLLIAKKQGSLLGCVT